MTRFFATPYGTRIEGQQYADGWLFEIQCAQGGPFAVAKVTAHELRLFDMLLRAIVVEVRSRRGRAYWTMWVPNALFLEHYPEGGPPPQRRTGPLPVAPALPEGGEALAS